MSIQSKPRIYGSFLLRLWMDSDSQTWRFSLENPHTGERHGFANLDALTTFDSQPIGKTEINESAARRCDAGRRN